MKVLGIGNALVDIMVSIKDDIFLNDNNLPKGSMQLVNKEISEKILKSASNYPNQIASGGSAANTINGLARLGVKTGFIGMLGKDEMGQRFIDDFKKNNVTPHITYSETHSGKAIALVSPDSERTFATDLGAAIELNSSNIKPEIISNYKLIHIEGYLLQNYDLIESTIKQAKANGLKISLDLASFNVVEQNIDFLKKLIPGNIDILFANEEESYSLTRQNPEKAIYTMAEMVPLSIIKIGPKGSIIFNRENLINIEAIKTNCIDTTGAGDLYASGFIYGLLTNKTLDICGYYGSLLASKVISIIGAKIDEEQWNDILKEINN
jgi:sugar/nucleoside kinase (ribokinase family)